MNVTKKIKNKMAKGNKFKIIIFIMFILIAIVVVVELQRFLQSGFGAINLKKNELNCANYKYNLEKINYREDRLVLHIESNTIGMDINSLTIIPDNKNSGMIHKFDTPIKNGEKLDFTISNITINNNYEIYVNNCYDKVQKYEI